MLLKQELLQYPKHIEGNQVYMFTGNRVVHRGGLVMGGGNAFDCLRAYPYINKRFAQKLPSDKHNLFVKQKDGFVGCMFTKNHYKDPSDLDTVIAAIKEFQIFASKRPHYTFHLPFPAVGLGGLSKEDLAEHIAELPDNVLVYYKK